MTDERELYILKILMEEFIGQEKVRLVSSSEFKRNIGNFSKKTGIPEYELRQIIEPMIRRQVDKMLAR